jgi:hypothetical protein
VQCSKHASTETLHSKMLQILIENLGKRTPWIEVKLSKSGVVGLRTVPRDLTGRRRHCSSSETEKGISAQEIGNPKTHSRKTREGHTPHLHAISKIVEAMSSRGGSCRQMTSSLAQSGPSGLRDVYGLERPPVFLKLFIPKGFKFNILKLLIPGSLQAYFWKCRFQRS